MPMAAASHRTSEKSHSQDGTKTIGQINRELQEVHDRQPATARCAWCSWTFEGTAVEARDAFAFHRSSAHPDRVNGASARELLDRMDAGESVAATSGPRTWTREEIIEAIQRWAREHDGKPPMSTMWMKSKAGHPQTSTVINRFGSWSKGIAAAGFEKPTRGSSVFPPSTEEPKPEPVDPPPAVEKPSPKQRRPRKVQAAKPPARRKKAAGLVEIIAPDGAGTFAERCELEAARHETAAAAYRQVAGGIRALEELTRD